MVVVVPVVQPQLEGRAHLGAVRHRLDGDGEAHRPRRRHGAVARGRLRVVAAGERLDGAGVVHPGVGEPGHGVQVEGRLLLGQGQGRPHVDARLPVAREHPLVAVLQVQRVADVVEDRVEGAHDVV